MIQEVSVESTQETPASSTQADAPEPAEQEPAEPLEPVLEEPAELEEPPPPPVPKTRVPPRVKPKAKPKAEFDKQRRALHLKRKRKELQGNLLKTPPQPKRQTVSRAFQIPI